MSTTSSKNNPTTNVEFIQYHQPLLESGKYRVTVEHAFSDANSEIVPQTYSTSQNFFVAGERFQILPDQVAAVFPPNLSIGDHSNVFPHMMISRNTLPWEREAVKDDPETPWMALLVVHEEEASQVQVSTKTLADLEGISASSPFFPGIEYLEPGQSADQKVTVLDIEKSLLQEILPNKTALQYLTHIRQGLNDADELVGEDMAVLIANRMPDRIGQSTVYLVSLEDRYDSAGNFDWQTSEAGDSIRLVHLYSWKFTCTDPDKDFPNLVKNLLKEHDHSTRTLRKADTGHATTDDFLAMGFYPLPHKLRQGGQTVSWYHGPLAPKSNSETIDLPAQGSDALLRYYASIGMFDASYASAWELGRLLALQNTNFSTELYQWKRRQAQARNQQNQSDSGGVSHLQGGNKANASEPMPPSCVAWLEDLKLLKGVPFGYLVPDEELLPQESIRFFQLDALWIESLLDGAMSIGRVTSGDIDLDIDIREEENTLTAGTVSGFIMRSEAVSGWPGMLIEGYSDSAATIAVDQSRRSLLSGNTMICLFKDDIEVVDFHLKPEVLHFGADAHAESGFSKKLRDAHGNDDQGPQISMPVDLKSVLDVDTLLSRIDAAYQANTAKVDWTAAPTSANLALQMLEGVERIRFLRTV